MFDRLEAILDDSFDEKPPDHEPTGAASALDIPLALSFGKSNRDVRPKVQELSLRDLAARWATPDTSRGTLSLAEYRALDKKDPVQKKRRDAEKNGEYFSAARFKDNSRAAGAVVESLSACVLDCDGGKITGDEIAAKLAGIAHVAYTSYSHHPGEECWRVVIPFQQPVGTDLHARAWRHFDDVFSGRLDPSSKTAARIYYTPACPHDAVADYQCILVDGAEFDPSSLPEPAPQKEADDTRASSAAPSVGGKNVDVEELKDALGYLDPDDYRTWIDVGHALKHDLGEVGQRIWLDWSSRSPKFNYGEATERWDGMKPRTDGKAITVGTIFHLAKQAGWVRKTVPNEIAELNERYFVSRIGGKVCVFLIEEPSGSEVLPIVTAMKVADFRTKLGNRFVTRAGGDGKPKALADYWLAHPQRRQYERVVFAPGGDAPPDCFNTWQGFAVTPKRDSWKLLNRHIFEVFCMKDVAAYRYFLNWLAYLVQFPGQLGEVAVVLRGGRGTGKSTLGRVFARVFGPHAISVSNPRHVTGNFNAHLQSTCFLFVDEGLWAGDKAAEGVLKQLITEPRMPIERKGFDVESAQNHLHVLMASNNDWVVPAGHDERRFFVLEVDDAHKQDAVYFNALHAEIEGGGVAAMLHDLLKRDLSNFDIRRVPQTAALGEQKLLSLDAGLTWWHGRLASGELISSQVITSGPLAGTSTAPVPWGQVEKSRLQHDYEKGMSGQHASRKGTANALHALLKKVLPPGYPISRRVTLQPGGPQVAVYDLPPLQACRDRFEEHLGLKGQIDWANGGCARGPVVARTQQVYVTGITSSASIGPATGVNAARASRRIERVEPQRIVLLDGYRSGRRG